MRRVDFDTERRAALRATSMVLAWLVLALLMLMLIPRPAAGQTAWETPRFLSPQTIGGAGFYYVRYAALPGDGQGGFLVWHPAGLTRGVSLRAGAAEGVNGVVAGFGGVDAGGPIATHSDALPLDISWNVGAGVAVGEYLIASLPLGLAAGRSWESGSFWLSPYAAARAALDLRMGELAPNDEFQVSAGLDLGLDVAFDRERTVILRLSTSLGDRSAIAAGVVIGG